MASPPEDATDEASTGASSRPRLPPPAVQAALAKQSQEEAPADRPARSRLAHWWRRGKVVAVLVAVAVAVSQIVILQNRDDHAPGIAGLPALVADRAPEADHSDDPYAGYGTWVDIYDYVPAAAGGSPAVTPDTVDEMAERGVRTLYLQTGQLDPAFPELIIDPVLISEILVRAHLAGIEVVGWYLPRFTDLDRDLAHLTAIADFEVLGHRFDGIAVDIEWTNGIRDHAARSEALVELSERLRREVGDDQALGAIVLPPVQIEVVNPAKWPNFPWPELADLYDVWLPMGYWTVRSPESGYQDGLTYTTESVRRLRNNLDDPDAQVHVIGGIGDGIPPEQADRFAQAIEESEAVGASIYDWATLDPTLHRPIADATPSPDD